MMRRFQFRIWHLLILVVAVSFGLWYVLVAGTKSAEIEILRYEVSHGTTTISYRFVDPETSGRTTLYAIGPNIKGEFSIPELVGRRIEFRFPIGKFKSSEQSNRVEKAERMIQAMAKPYLEKHKADRGELEIEERLYEIIPID